VAAAAERSRRALHLFDVATLPGPAKEIRVFGLRDELLARYRAEWRSADDVIDAAERRAALLRIAGTAIAGAGYAVGLWFLVHQIRNGAVTAGDVYVALSTATRLTDQMGRSAGTLGALRHARNVADRFLWLDDYAKAARPEPAAAPVPLELRHGIDFRNVSFTYDGATEPSLHDVTLHLPAGSVVALVGENGAGKSTLLKLLFGFYRPTQGDIAVDGLPLDAIGSTAWRARTSACVQDHARFFVPAGETIGVGDLDSLHDRDAVVAATRRAAADDVIARLPAGYDELLGPLRGGVDLSGGQWQKLAIARAMMREEPLLVALDEPTSALDPLAEHEMFERYAASAKALAERQGTITVLVSHRFSTVRIADLIVVVDGGTVREVGRHDELVRRGGLYAELYALQAAQYR
jgi:ATP-binding cassette subfamily B protein